MLNERMKSMMWGIFHLRLRLINELEKVSWVRREKLPKDRRFFPRVGDIELSLYTYLLTYLLTYFTYFTYLLTYLLTYLFTYGCVGSSFLREGFLQLWQVGATPHRGAQASHYRGLSCCGAQAPDAQAQYLWLTGLVAPWHVGSSQTRARTRVPCIGRQILNHCTTREAPPYTRLNSKLGSVD